MLKIILTLVFYNLYFFVNSQEKINSKIIEQQEDFEIFKTTLKECHIGLYNYNNEESINYLFQKLETKISEKELSNFELLAHYSHFISNIKCIHTSIGYKHFNKITSQYRRLDALIYFCDNELFSRNSYEIKNFNLNKNDKILEINDEPILKIKDSLFNFIPSDGDNLTFKERNLRNNFFTFHLKQ